MSFSRVGFLFAVFVTVSLSLDAATFVVPADRDLVRHADAIVIGSPLTSHTQLTRDGGIETATAFSVEEVIKGMNPTGLIDVVEPGGTYGNVTTAIAGVPRFVAGERVMLFLMRTGSDRWAVEELVLGKFRFATDVRNRDLLLRDADEIVGWDPQLQTYRERTRAAAPFLRFVRSEARGISSSEQYFLEDPAPLRAKPFTAMSTALPSAVAPAATFTATSYTMAISGSLGSRWNVFPSAVTFFTGTTSEPGAPGGGTTAAQTALAAWTNDCASNVNYVYGGTDNGTHTGGLRSPDGANTILYEQDLSSWGVSPFSCGSGGTLGIGGITNASGSNTVNGETFVTTLEGDVMMNRGIANCTTLFNSGDFNTAVTHEVGHTLGFRHSDQNRTSNGACSTDPSLECSNTAVMKSFIPTGINAALQAWDQNAVRLVYPGGSCGTPTAPKRGDMDGNGISDIFWRNTSTGANTLWFVNGNGFTGSATMPSLSSGYTMSGVGDFNHDGRADILWRNLTTGDTLIWLMNGGTRIGTLNLPASTADWSIVGVGDFDGNGYADIFWRNTQNGQNGVWLFSAGGFTDGRTLPAIPFQELKVISVADVSGDGRADIVWRNMNTGEVWTWMFNLDGSLARGEYIAKMPLTIALLGTGDFNGDGTFDLLWYDTQSGKASVWFLHNGQFIGGGWELGASSLSWKIVGVGDFNGDGFYDLLWRNETTGENGIWFITAAGFTGGATLPGVSGTAMQVVSPPRG